jgi:TolB-like protein/DNA-binding winged helix-turn-helix (wHTH) protein
MPEVQPESTPIRFGTFEVDPSTGELRKSGLRIKLQEQPCRVLLTLLERAGELVTREELKRELMPDSSFGDFDHAINVAVAKLRTALGDSPDAPRYIETLPRRGYRFVYPVSARESTAVPQPIPDAPAPPAATAILSEPITTGRHLQRWVLLAAIVIVSGLVFLWWTSRKTSRAVSVPSTGKLMLAVLPFENLSGDPAQEYFSDGMTEEMITLLGNLYPQRLGVIARTSTVRYKHTSKGASQIGRELGVQYLLEGSAWRVGDRVRITAQLVRIEDETHLWAETYERDLRDVFRLQDEVATAIVAEVRAKLTVPEQTRLSSARWISPEAHEAYLRGLYSFNQGRERVGTPRGDALIRKGIEYFEHAIQIEPSYALAYAQIARCHHWLATAGAEELFSASRASALKALQLDDTVAEAHVALAYVMFRHEGDWMDAESEYQRALALNPSYDEAHHGYGLFLMAAGRVNEAVAEFDRAEGLDPISLPLKANSARANLCAHQYDRAIEKFRSLVELDPGNRDWHFELGRAYIQKAMHQQGVAEIRQYGEPPGNDPDRLAALAWAYAVSGNKGEAILLLDQLKKLPKPSPYDIATVYAGLGDKDQAFQWLQNALELRAQDLTYIKCWPEFESLHSDPRFQALMQRLGLPR